MATFDNDAVAQLEAALADHPDSLDVRERLLEHYLIATDADAVRRRLGHIRWFISRHPDSYLCRSPFAHFNHDAHPEEYSACLALWRAARASQPKNSAILQGLALFLAPSDLEGAMAALAEALRDSPNDAELWLLLGRLCPEPQPQLAAFSQAHDNGSTSSNLPVWRAKAAVEAGELALAVTLAEELLAQVHMLRETFGQKLDWTEKGNALWQRAFGETGNRDDARALIRAIGDAAYKHHWAHTVLGLVSCAKGEFERAEEHLLLSGHVRPDHRLGAYGPSPDLVRELCRQGRHDVPLRFLQEWRSASPSERIDQWIHEIEDGGLPGEPDAG